MEFLEIDVSCYYQRTYVIAGRLAALSHCGVRTYDYSPFMMPSQNPAQKAGDANIISNNKIHTLLTPARFPAINAKTNKTDPIN